MFGSLGGALFCNGLPVSEYANFSGTFTATDVGDISHGVRHATSGHSSTTYGYANLGYDAGGTKQNVIQKC